MKLVDAHTHISSESYDDDRAEVLERARKLCAGFIDIGAGTSKDSHRRARQTAEQEQDVFFTAGIHPHDAQNLGRDANLRSEIESMLTHPKCVAVGECGLDFYYEHSGKEDQYECFQWQISLAEKYELPLMIHTREAEKDSMRLLADYEGGGVFHCFTSSQELADFGIKKGFYISFSGIVTFKKAHELRDVFLKTPMDRILIETDAPYLAPEPMRGKRNESAFLIHTAEYLAKLRGISAEEFVESCFENTKRCFPKLKLDA